MKHDLLHWKFNSSLQSKTTNNSHSALSTAKFRFDRPPNLLFKPTRPKRGGSSGNLLDLSETCMHNEEDSSKIFSSISVESQTETLDSFGQSLYHENTDLVSEVKSLRLEINELKNIVKELQMFKLQTQLKDNQEKIGELEKENNTIKKILRPPMPKHRHTQSNSLL